MIEELGNLHIQILPVPFDVKDNLHVLRRIAAQ